MNWDTIDSIESLENCQFTLIFKHSPRCIISRIVLERFENNYESKYNYVKFFKINVIDQRKLSTTISTLYNVQHESPQILLIKYQECLYHESHESINFRNLKSYLK